MGIVKTSDIDREISILLVATDGDEADRLKAYLDEHFPSPVDLTQAVTLSAALEHLGAEPPDAVLFDLAVPDSEGIASIHRIREVAPATPVIMLTGDRSLEALKEGTQDYLRKSEIYGGSLPLILRHAMERQRLLNALAMQSERLMAIDWALLDSERRFKAFLEASPDSICIKDAEGRYVLANPVFEKRMGLKPKEWIGATARDIYSPEWADLVERHDRHVFESGTEEVFEVDIHPVLGSECYERVVKFPLRGVGGEIIGLGAMAADITDRKRAEQSLADSLRALKVLSACNEILVRAKSEDWLLRKICETIGEIGGYPLVWVGFIEEPERQYVRPVASFGDRDRLLETSRLPCGIDTANDCAVKKAAQDGTIAIANCKCKAQVCAPLGELSEHHRLCSVLSMPLVEKKTFGILSIFSYEPNAFGEEEVERLKELASDLSFGIHALRQEKKRKAAEAELRKLSRAVEQSPSIVIITDAAGDIEYVNPKFTAVSGYAANEVMGKNPRLLRYEPTKSDADDIWETIRQGREWRGVFQNRHKDGSSFWVDAAISPVRGNDGEITHYIGIQEDITERRLTEQRLRQAEKMEALGSLAGGIAHDFNNMLLPILTLTRMVMRDFSEDDKQYGRLRNVVEAAERASELVKRILTFSRTAEIEKKDSDLAEILHQSLDLLRATLPTTIKIMEHIDSDIGSAVVDQAQLQTIVLNLASNAADALAGSNGRLDIFLERASLPETEFPDGRRLSAGTYARLAVADNGPGIPATVLPHVLEPFYTTKKVGEGTGLGLAMVHGIVTEHGGSISIESEEGEGTRIDILLPLEKGTRTAVPAE